MRKKDNNNLNQEILFCGSIWYPQDWSSIAGKSPPSYIHHSKGVAFFDIKTVVVDTIKKESKGLKEKLDKVADVVKEKWKENNNKIIIGYASPDFLK